MLRQEDDFALVQHALEETDDLFHRQTREERVQRELQQIKEEDERRKLPDEK